MKHASNWYNAIAHVDADCFFAGCESIRRPDLKGQPICVLSSQDACVVAKTYDAKSAGITTGMPVWDAKKLMPQAHFLSADFRYYGLISEKMFSIFRRYSPEVEAYSIDEGFIDMNGIRSMWGKSYRGIADHMRETIFNEVGITVSVGISTTRILAKIASEMNKPNGTTIIPARRITNFLRDVPVGDIPGIGGSRKQLMRKLNITTAYDFASAPLERVDLVLGKVGIDLWNELNGTPVFKLELNPPAPKSITRSASFGQVTRDKQLINSHITYHTTRVVTELVRHNRSTSYISVFLRLKSFQSVGRSVRITATNDYSTLNHIVKSILNHIFSIHSEYRACGVIVSNIQPDVQQGDLFTEPLQANKQLTLTKVLDAINTRFGDQMIRPASALKKEQPKMRFQYPLFYAY